MWRRRRTNFPLLAVLQVPALTTLRALASVTGLPHLHRPLPLSSRQHHQQRWKKQLTSVLSTKIPKTQHKDQSQPSPILSCHQSNKLTEPWVYLAVPNTSSSLARQLLSPSSSILLSNQQSLPTTLQNPSQSSHNLLHTQPLAQSLIRMSFPNSALPIVSSGKELTDDRFIHSLVPLDMNLCFKLVMLLRVYHPWTWPTRCIMHSRLLAVQSDPLLLRLQAQPQPQGFLLDLQSVITLDR